jgi:hypothetical protein
MVKPFSEFERMAGPTGADSSEKGVSNFICVRDAGRALRFLWVAVFQKRLS